MSPYLNEWLNLFLRWIHIIAAIMWIGDSLFFMWLDSHLTPPEEGGREDVAGELWMVHSGAFYQVEKKKTLSAVPKQLYWFKWEATATWISGFCLLIVVYYFGGALVAYGSDLGAGKAAMIGLGLLPVSWFVYDALFQSPLGKIKWVAPAIAIVLVLGVAYFLSHTLSGRAAYIHVGAMFGTLMVLNVWRRILPSQNSFLAATEKGTQPDFELAKNAKRRSVHNNYMTFPVIFIMISNHFPTTTLGYDWAMLAVLMLAGAGVRHWINVGKHPSGPTVAVASLVVLLATTLALRPSPSDSADEPEATPATDPAAAKGSQKGTAKSKRVAYSTVDAATHAAIEGVVSFEGTPPARTPVRMNTEALCVESHESPPLSESIVVKDGRLQNVFVRVSEGLDGFSFQTPKEEVIIDQVGCIYIPHVIGVQTKQKFTFLNSDNTLHNIHTRPKTNREFNLAMPQKGSRLTKKMSKPEIMVETTCDVHPWMNAYIGVVRHPFFSVTGEDGKFSLAGLPPGDYTVTAWHESLGTKTATVSLGPSEKKSASFTFSGSTP